MKRLVVCCDGTWNKPESKNITNVEKLARSVEIDSAKTDGVQQVIHYVSGVGTHWYWFDRVFGGAFGCGLFGNIASCYRFLALNYESGDEIFVFGFSRGAYTARSLVGMIGKVGLVTRESLVGDSALLLTAETLYRPKRGQQPAIIDDLKAFKRDHCHAPDIKLLGVFDTVGALGVPGALQKRHQFHDVKLSKSVLCARQALAIDDPRIKFEPCIWEPVAAAQPGDTEDPSQLPDRIKQVWFEGAHSDVGGGTSPTGLPDTALRWMVREAAGRGLEFDSDSLSVYTERAAEKQYHDPMNTLYRVLNAIGRIKNRINRNKNFKGTRRVLNPPTAGPVMVAASVAEHWNKNDGYRPPNIGWFIDAQPGGKLDAVMESVDFEPAALEVNEPAESAQPANRTT